VERQPAPILHRAIATARRFGRWPGPALAVAVIASICLAVPSLSSAMVASPVRLGQSPQRAAAAAASSGTAHRSDPAVRRNSGSGDYLAQLDRACGSYLRAGASIPTPVRGDDQGLAAYLDRLAEMTDRLGDLVHDAVPPPSLRPWHEEISRGLHDMASAARRMAGDLREHRIDAYARGEKALTEAAGHVAVGGHRIGSTRCQAVGTY
jgi:hypothetical protein